MKTIKSMVLSATIVLMMATSVFAQSMKASINVSVNVLPFITRTIAQHAQTVTVTAGDIARGYVDVIGATRLEVMTNSRGGYLISFAMSAANPFGEVLVMDGARSVALSPSGGLVHEPNTTGLMKEVRELSYRLFLASGAKTGVYEWPLMTDVIAE